MGARRGGSGGHIGIAGGPGTDALPPAGASGRRERSATGQCEMVPNVTVSPAQENDCAITPWAGEAAATMP